MLDTQTLESNKNANQFRSKGWCLLKKLKIVYAIPLQGLRILEPQPNKRWILDTHEENKGAQVKSQTKQDQDLAVDLDDDTNVVERLELDLGLLVIDQV